jgi:hypothetical protein
LQVTPRLGQLASQVLQHTCLRFEQTPLFFDLGLVLADGLDQFCHLRR